MLQTSGGSTGKPLLWARTQADLEDIYHRVARKVTTLTGSPPVRVALVGGVSHTQAALHWKMDAVEVRSFDHTDTKQLEPFAPDLLSCYPSIARDLFLGPSSLAIPSLRILKLGGERVYRADITRLHGVLPKVPVLEQFGSTEIPALAFRSHLNGMFQSDFLLETDRFEAHFDLSSDGWQDVLVSDTFPDLACPLEGAYAMGDQALVRRGTVIDFRRHADPALKYAEMAESLFSQGAVNLQIDPARRAIHYCGDANLPSEMTWEGEPYRLERKDTLPRAAGSNKLPLVLETGPA